MGLGLLGGALNDAIFLAECGAKLIITDLKSEQELAPSLKKLAKYKGIKYVLGEHKLEDFKRADIILQPGNVPPNSPYLLEAKKNKIPIHESESLFFECLPEGVKIIGVTGTRGKTTTTHLIYEILKSALGQKVFLGGNIKGTSALSLLNRVKAGNIVVMELDSWCLHGIGQTGKSPHISVFTNLMPDHLNYYLKDSADEAEAMQKYFMDKAQIFANQKKGDYLILDNEIKKIITERYKGKIKSEIILIADNSEIKNWKIKIKGDHNYKHILRAVAVAKILGIDLKIIKKAVENFKGVPGRLELVREFKGIKIYNDTTATTPDGTIAALQALGKINQGEPLIKKKVVLICGGADKGLDMSGLEKEIPKYCREVFLLDGTGSAKLNLEGTIKCANLKEAVMGAVKKCKRGDILLLSPAFASFGMFKNEYDRGDKFNSLINGLK